MALLERALPLHTDRWLRKIECWRAQHPIEMKSEHMTPQNIIHAINQTFADAVITTDVGQNQLWATQFLELNEHKQMLMSGGLGTMGFL